MLILTFLVTPLNAVTSRTNRTLSNNDYPTVDNNKTSTNSRTKKAAESSHDTSASTTDPKTLNKLRISESAILTRLANISATSRDDKLSFSLFINRFITSAFKKNIWGFPIKEVEQIMDPKTNAVPKILIPSTINKNDITRGEIEVIALPELKVDNNGIKRIIDEVDPNSIIWLPHSYIVAGSFHKEMYPHDTSAVIWAILELAKGKNLEHTRSNLKLIKNQLENFSYEVKTFGFPLNGNRGYYITRSQTNNIPTNVLQYYLLTKDASWLKSTGLPMSEDIFNYWTNRSAEIQTSNGVGYRWIAHGQGPCIEVMESHEAHSFYYFKVLEKLIEFSKMDDSKRPVYAKGFDYKKVIETIPKYKINQLKEREKLHKQEIPNLAPQVEAYLLDHSVSQYNQDEPVIKIGNSFYKLAEKYYVNDRASRVSGYDTNHLYGPFNAFTYDFIPADHNILLYRHAKDIAKMHDLLGNQQKSLEYNNRADKLKQMIMKTLWDPKSNMFYEYNAKTKTLRTDYPFLSSAYAIWAEIFDITNPTEKQKLIRVVKYLEENLEGSIGFYASSIETGMHWDKPYIWPVQQQYIVGGLREYANKLQIEDDNITASYLIEVADRIAIKYLLANYADWLSSNGTTVGEKVLPRTEKLFTGYSNGSNYTWNLTAVNYLYKGLSNRAKEVFDSLIE